MKQLLLVFLLCIGISFTAKSQTLPLNKQQTLDYLNREYAKINVKYFKKLILDSKVLIFEYKDDRIRRVN
ncbi:MAG: hypothetical protein JWR72_1188, partial [Flavisolibacter sp.]|nr:hypothetical protein [Flavisolibacter sp.]